MASSPRAVRHVENHPTGHRARARWRTWRGCLRSQLETPSTSTPLAEAVVHRHRARSAGAASKRRNRTFRFLWRAAHARIAPWRTSRPPTEHVACALQTWRGCLRCQRGARSTPPAVGRGSSSPRPHQVGGGGFRTLESKVSNSMACGPRTVRQVENYPTAHRARARWRTWCGCLRGQLATRSTPCRWLRLFFTVTSRFRRLRLRGAVFKAFGFSDVRITRASPRGEPADRPRSTHRALRSWRGCLRGQLATRFTPRRWPRLFFTDAAPDRRSRLPNAVIKGSEFRGV